jgi:type III pantothenate kinase
MAVDAVWAVDAGNTAIKFQLFQEGVPGPRLVVLRRDLMESRAHVEQSLISAAGTNPAARAVVVSCARADDRELVAGLIALLAPGAAPRFLSAEDPLPFRIEYSSGRPGPDRLANIMALRTLFPGQPALAVDFGTATNIVVVNERGDFAGGVILPGIGVQAESLVKATAGRLPMIPLTGLRSLSPLADSTQGRCRPASSSVTRARSTDWSATWKCASQRRACKRSRLAAGRRKSSPTPIPT